jgi:hypothetical protein
MSKQVSKQKPDFSKWTLRYKAFGRDFEFSWLARNLEVSVHFFIATVTREDLHVVCEGSDYIAVTILFVEVCGGIFSNFMRLLSANSTFSY